MIGGGWGGGAVPACRSRPVRQSVLVGFSSNQLCLGLLSASESRWRDAAKKMKKVICGISNTTTSLLTEPIVCLECGSVGGPPAKRSTA